MKVMDHPKETTMQCSAGYVGIVARNNKTILLYRILLVGTTLHLCLIKVIIIRGNVL